MKDINPSQNENAQNNNNGIMLLGSAPPEILRIRLTNNEVNTQRC